MGDAEVNNGAILLGAVLFDAVMDGQCWGKNWSVVRQNDVDDAFGLGGEVPLLEDDIDGQVFNQTKGSTEPPVQFLEVTAKAVSSIVVDISPDTGVEADAITEIPSDIYGWVE